MLATLSVVPVQARAQQEYPERHAQEAAEAGAHGEEANLGAHHGEEEPAINWDYGFLGEKDGVEPGLAWRPKGMPPPVMANVFNSLVLFGLLIYFGRKPLAEGLKKRKARIVAGMDEAARMKREAAERLEEYEEKLKRIDEEIERVRSDMRAAAEAERQRILAEAKERRIRMERDAKVLVEQELKAARELLVKQAVTGAIKSAEEILKKELSPSDHERLANDYLGMVKSPAALNALGGKA